jgi:hypothetical protein
MSLENVKKNDLESKPLLSEPSHGLVSEATLPLERTQAKSLIKTLPRWWRVARLWFFGGPVFLLACTEIP